MTWIGSCTDRYISDMKGMICQSRRQRRRLVAFSSHLCASLSVMLVGGASDISPTERLAVFSAMVGWMVGFLLAAQGGVRLRRKSRLRNLWGGGEVVMLSYIDKSGRLLCAGPHLRPQTKAHNSSTKTTRRKTYPRRDKTGR